MRFEHFEYEVRGGTAIITKEGSFRNRIVVPAYINGLKVVGLGTNCFSQRLSLREIFLPDELLYLGDYCFNNCLNLKKVIFGRDLNSLGNYTFANCDLIEVTIPNKVHRIGSYCFVSNDNLERVVLGSSVGGLGEGCFGFCPRLVEIEGLDRFSRVDKYRAFSGNLRRVRKSHFPVL